jgi:hypothetical protein
MSACTREQPIYAAADRPEGGATYDFYFAIHKGLRLGLSRLLVRLGAVDPADPQAVAEVLADLRIQLAVSRGHLEKEDAVIHAALQAFAPEAVWELERDHDHHREAFAALEAGIAAVEAARERTAPLHGLYLGFSRFVADDFAHMAHEEQETLPVLQALFTDEELIAMDQKVRQGMTPEQLAAGGRLILPALRPAERSYIVAAMKAVVPQPAFAALMASIAPALAPDQRAQLKAEFGLEPRAA